MKDLSNENVVQVERDGIKYLQFKRLLEYSDILVHAYGIGLDRNFRTIKSRGIDKYNLAVNDYKKLCEAVDEDYINIIKPNQAHTNNVKSVWKKVNENEPDFNLEEYNLTDGLITNQKNFILSTTNADCILLMFFDPTKKVVANVHSGWRGTMKKISVNTVCKMKEEYGCKAEDIICCICPSIGKCHFEVEKDVEGLFEEEFKDLKGIDKLIVRKSEKKWLIDTIEINKIMLQEQGLKQDNIVDCGICSVCNSDIIHSFRVEKEGYGLGTALIGLR